MVDSIRPPRERTKKELSHLRDTLGMRITGEIEGLIAVAGKMNGYGKIFCKKLKIVLHHLISEPLAMFGESFDSGNLELSNYYYRQIDDVLLNLRSNAVPYVDKLVEEIRAGEMDKKLADTFRELDELVAEEAKSKLNVVSIGEETHDEATEVVDQITDAAQ